MNSHDPDTDQTPASNDIEDEAKRLADQLFNNAAVIRSLTACGFENVNIDVAQCDRSTSFSMVGPENERPPTRLEVVLAIRLALLENGYRAHEDGLTFTIENQQITGTFAAEKRTPG